MNSAYLHSVEEVIAELHDRGFFADCSALVTDSRRVGPQDVFLAVPGQEFDPRNLADDMIENSRCGLVLVEYDETRAYQVAQVIAVKGLKSMLAELAKVYYGDPSAKLRVIGVTGTNGKTTVTRWLAQLLNLCGYKAGVVGTLGFGSPGQMRTDAGLTTPD
ncbi:MAG: Mur ligase family protein, partial [Limnobacter sp.]|nr:Mur ligase family protein [Limnobacter sp.]